MLENMGTWFIIYVWLLRKCGRRILNKLNCRFVHKLGQNFTNKIQLPFWSLYKCLLYKCSWRKELRSLKIGGWKKQRGKRGRKRRKSCCTGRVPCGLTNLNWKRRYLRLLLILHPSDSFTFHFVFLDGNTFFFF